MLAIPHLGLQKDTNPWPHDFVTHVTSAQGRWTNSRGFMKIIVLYRIILLRCFLYAFQSYCAFSDFVEVWSYIQNSLLYITIYCLRTGIANQSGPGSSVGIATGYGLDGPGIESRWGRDFPHLSRPALGPTQPPIQWVPALSRGHRTAGAWRWPLTPF